LAVVLDLFSRRIVGWATSQALATTAATTGPCATLQEDAGVSECFPQSDADLAAFVNVFCGTGT
jgi:hypothetical protein